jgi:hypothetical protein
MLKELEQKRKGDAAKTIGQLVAGLRTGAKTEDPPDRLTLAEARKEVARLRTRVAEVDAALTPAKDPFETTAEYKARIAKPTAEPLEAQYRKELAAANRVDRNRITFLTTAWYPAPNLRANRLDYDADQQTLNALVVKNQYVFHLSPSEARILNGHRMELIVNLPYEETDQANWATIQLADTESGRSYTGVEAHSLRKSF